MPSKETVGKWTMWIVNLLLIGIIIPGGKITLDNIKANTIAVTKMDIVLSDIKQAVGLMDAKGTTRLQDHLSDEREAGAKFDALQKTVEKMDAKQEAMDAKITEILIAVRGAASRDHE